MIYLVKLMSFKNKNSCHSEVLVAAKDRAELKSKLEDLTDCVEAICVNNDKWRLKGLDLPVYCSFDQSFKLEFKEDAVSYAYIRELSGANLEEYLDGKETEEYKSVLKNYQYLTKISGDC